MTQYGSGETSELDDIRQSEGIERCKAVFSDACKSDTRRAVSLMNDGRLTFGCLYLILPVITQFRLERYMSPRNMAALRTVRSIGEPKRQSGPDFSARNDTTRAALKWMLDTGRADDGLSDEYEEALEVAASVLIVTYDEADMLPAVVDMIFDRNREERNIHSLVWVVFQSKSPEALKRIAQRMRSPERRDVRLACSLLGIEMPEGASADDYRRQTEHYLQWLEYNDPFLYFTGESFQYSSRPAFYSVDQERRYIHRGTPFYDWQPVSPADEGERAALAAFSTLGAEQQAQLSEYSHMLYSRDPAEWKAWVRRPIEEQVKSAKSNRGDSHDYGFRTFV